MKKMKILAVIILILVIILLGYVCLKNNNEADGVKNLNTNTVEQEELKERTKVDEEEVKDYINSIYINFGIKLPSFDDINLANENWVWITAFYNVEDYIMGDVIKKDKIEDKSKDLFGDNLKKELPKEGIEGLIEPVDEGYCVSSVRLDGDYVEEYEFINIDIKDNEVIVEIAEYKYDVLRGEDGLLEVKNIANEEVIKKFNAEDYGENYESLYEDISEYVKNNPNKFSTAKLTLEVNENTGKLNLKSVER